MKMKRSKKTLSFILCMVLLVAMAQFTTGCNDKTNKENSVSVESDMQEMETQQTEEIQQAEETKQTEETKQAEKKQQTEENQKTEESQSESVTKEMQVVGKGSTVFPFCVVDKDGNVTNFEIHTDKTVVGEALVDLGLIEGENGDYGLYVKKVNGITADYDTDGVYWAFYINGEYAQTGVDVTEIKEGDSYTFKVE